MLSLLFSTPVIFGGIGSLAALMYNGMVTDQNGKRFAEVTPVADDFSDSHSAASEGTDSLSSASIEEDDEFEQEPYINIALTFGGIALMVASPTAISYLAGICAVQYIGGALAAYYEASIRSSINNKKGFKENSPYQGGKDSVDKLLGTITLGAVAMGILFTLGAKFLLAAAMLYSIYDAVILKDTPEKTRSSNHLGQAAEDLHNSAFWAWVMYLNPMNLVKSAWHNFTAIDSKGKNIAEIIGEMYFSVLSTVCYLPCYFGASLVYSGKDFPEELRTKANFENWAENIASEVTDRACEYLPRSR